MWTWLSPTMEVTKFSSGSHPCESTGQDGNPSGTSQNVMEVSVACWRNSNKGDWFEPSNNIHRARLNFLFTTNMDNREQKDRNHVDETLPVVPQVRIPDIYEIVCVAGIKDPFSQLIYSDWKNTRVSLGHSYNLNCGNAIGTDFQVFLGTSQNVMEVSVACWRNSNKGDWFEPSNNIHRARLNFLFTTNMDNREQKDRNHVDETLPVVPQVRIPDIYEIVCVAGIKDPFSQLIYSDWKNTRVSLGHSYNLNCGNAIGTDFQVFLGTSQNVMEVSVACWRNSNKGDWFEPSNNIHRARLNFLFTTNMDNREQKDRNHVDETLPVVPQVRIPDIYEIVCVAGIKDPFSQLIYSDWKNTRVSLGHSYNLNCGNAIGTDFQVFLGTSQNVMEVSVACWRNSNKGDWFEPSNNIHRARLNFLFTTNMDNREQKDRNHVDETLPVVPQVRIPDIYEIVCVAGIKDPFSQLIYSDWKNTRVSLGHSYNLNCGNAIGTDFQVLLYLTCRYARRWGCPVRAVHRNGRIRVPEGARHSHPPDSLLLRKQQFITALHHGVTHSYQRLRTVYEITSINFEDVANLVTFDLVRFKLERWRRTMEPPPVDSYLAMHRIFQSAEWAHLALHTRGNIYMNCITAADGQSAAIYGDTLFGQSVPEVQTLHIGMSSLLIPEIGNTTTVISVTAEVQNLAFTFGWGLMSEISYELCREMMTFIKRQLVPTLNPTSIVTNLDWRLKQSIGEIWSDAEIFPSFHQFCLTVLHTASCDYGEIDFENEHHKIILKKIIALSWMPANVVLESFQWIQRSMDIRTRFIFAPLLQWFHTHCIVGNEPESYSFYRKMERFRNVSSKVPLSLARTFRQQRSCSPWRFYRRTLKVAVSSWEDVEKMREGNARNISMTPRISSSILPKSSLTRLWNNYDHGRIPNVRFLSIAAQIMHDFFETIVWQGEFRLGQYSASRRQGNFQTVEDVRLYAGPHPDERALGMQFGFDGLDGEDPDAEDPEGNGDEEADIQIQPDEQGNVRPIDHYDWRCLRCEANRIEMISKPCNCVALCIPCESEIRDNPELRMECPACHQRATTFERVYLELTENPDSPYNWTCQICNEMPVTEMNVSCRQIRTCITCIQNIMRLNPDRALSCPFCNLVGNFERVNLPPPRI